MRALFWLIFLSACGSDALTVVTYNAGLAEGFVLGASERTEVTAAATAAVEADVICLQEVWLPEQVAAFQQAAAKSYPHSLFIEPAPDAGTGIGCAEDDLDPLFTCYEENCADGCFDEVASCLISNCALDFIALSDTCIGCLEANVGNADTAREMCETENTQFAYGGSYGIGILSAHPILSSEELVLDSTTNRRGTLHAVIDGPDGEVDIFCTHLTADLSPLPYTGPEDSWAAEQLTQINTLTQWVAQRAGSGLSVWMGDFNTGPDGAGFDAEIGTNFDALATIGWQIPYVETSQGCTWCPQDNGLITSGTRQSTIDHILVDGADDATLTATRVLDADVDVPVCGETVSAPTSDHYGVSVLIEP